MKKYLTIFFTIIGVVIAGISLYYQIFYKEKISLNIEKVTTTLLTRPLHIEGLKVSYTYHDTINVEELWQTTFVIRNTGTKTILGEGFAGKNIKNTYLPIHIENCIQLLSTSITNCNNDATLMNNHLYIPQWRPNEYVEITIISEGPNAPDLKISDREIVDSEITYSVYSPKIDLSNKKIIDYLPKGLAIFFKWSIVFTIFIMSITSIIQIRKQLKTIQGIGIKIFTFIAWLIIVLIFALPLLWIF